MCLGLENLISWVHARVLANGPPGTYETKYPCGQDAYVHVPMTDRVVFGTPPPSRLFVSGPALCPDHARANGGGDRWRKGRAAVADGVGGYNYEGADPAGFAWALVDGIEAHLAKAPAANLTDVFLAAKNNASASPIRDGASLVSTLSLLARPRLIAA